MPDREQVTFVDAASAGVEEKDRVKRKPKKR